MTAGESTKALPKPWWRRRWDALSLTHLAWAAVILVLGVSAAFGGLDRADHVERTALGETYDNGPFQVTPRAVTVIDALPGLPELPPQCRYLVLDVAIENVADEAVPVQLNPVVAVDLGCEPPSSRGSVAFDLASPAGVYVGAYRGRVERPVNVVEPGLVHDYAVVWTVPVEALTRDPNAVIRIYDMWSYVSTFRIAKDWGRTNTVKYAEFTVPVGSGA